MFGCLAKIPIFSRLRKPKKTYLYPETGPIQSHQPEKTRPFGSLFALIIGIDIYESSEIPPLLGAVADARAVTDYLIEKLHVPKANIQTLFDFQAKRSNIIEGFKNLTENPLIAPNNPILIFFAGHGTEAPSPDGWNSQNSMIQMIVPQDYRSIKDGKRVHAIPDRSIGVLLEELASTKGDNITVIFDCCHSGSGTRAGHRRVRSVKETESIPNDLDIELWSKPKEKRAVTPPEFKYHSGASHVLLAACASNQRAMENNGRGVFTRALLDTIIALGAENLTYVSLIKSIPDLPGQHPRCEGKNRNRLCFTTRAIRDEPFYMVKKNGENYVLEAGSVVGLAEGSEFALYPAPVKTETPFGKVIVHQVHPLTSIVKPDGNAISIDVLPAFATQTSFGITKALRIYLDNNPKLESLRNKLKHQIESNPHSCALVHPEEAQLHIRVHEETATFALANSLVQTLGLEQIPFRVSLKEEAIIMQVIEATSSFNLHLYNHPTDMNSGEYRANSSYQEPASISFMKLQRRGRNKWVPLAPADGAEDLNLNQDNQVEVIGGTTKYGLKITNNTEEDLYPYLFLFNCNDLSITSYYTSPTVKSVDRDAPLQKGGSVTVGYGDGGGSPWMHVVKPAKGTAQDVIIRDEEDLQVEFFKLILTTKPVDLSVLEQSTPFGPGGRSEKVIPELPDTWKTVLFAVVVRREDTSAGK